MEWDFLLFFAFHIFGCDGLGWWEDVPKRPANSDDFAEMGRSKGHLVIKKSPEIWPWSLGCKELSHGPPLGQR